MLSNLLKFKTVYKTIIIAMVILIANTAVAAPYWRTDFYKAEAEAKRNNKLLLLHFHAAWCGPCKRMDREVLSTNKLERVLGTSIIIVKIDSDQHPQLISRFGIRALPSDIFLLPNGKILNRTAGYVSPSQYLKTVYDNRIHFSQTKQELINQKRKQKSTYRKLKDNKFIGLRGYCLITLWNSRKWTMGDNKISAQYDGVTYYFTNKKQFELFTEDPEKFVPQLLGCDPVVVDEQDIAVKGSIQWAVFFDNKLYLFQNSKSHEKFKKDPIRFSKARKINSGETHYKKK